jgi:hypothetical protein
MSKITLITHPTDLTSFNAYYFKPILEKYFNVVEYDSANYYNPATSLIIISAFNKSNFWYQKLADCGIKVVVENLWERDEQPATGNNLTLLNKNWFWYNESMWYTYLGYDSYVPNKKYTHTAFMPIRLQKDCRDRLLFELTPYLDNMIYSYVSKGIYLPTDLPHDLDTLVGNFQRNFNPEWYNNTYFSIVTESLVNDLGEIFVSEKTFKPLAFYHPFLIAGQCGHLSHIRKLGFETFDNIFDESYDAVADFSKRLKLIVENVKNFNQTPYDNLTQNKLKHNRDLFFDHGVIEQKIVKEIFNPMIEFLEK